MELKHSPGPWSVKDWASHDKDGALEACGAQVVDADGHMVSACTIEGATETEEANAHLIAAAPELLATAHDFDEALTELGLHCECGRDNCRTTRLRRAIAKATGSAA